LVTAFNDDGFVLGTDGFGWVNYGTNTLVAWGWVANGGTTVTNEDGSIDSTVQANTTAGFSIVTYTGNGSAVTVGHGLQVNGVATTPDMFIVKRRNSTSGWATFHKDLTNATQYIQLNSTGGQGTGNNVWNQTDPSSTVFTVGTDLSVNTGTYVAYCFAEVEGYSKMGTYEGNGGADGTFVYTGFRPAFVMTKSVDSTSAWEMFDNKREGYNPDNDALTANTTAVEATADQIDFLSNGFKLRIATDPNVAETYIYMAFAEAPFKYANAR